MRATAVRETREELGLAEDVVEVLGGLDPVRTRVTGFQVWPFVGRLRAVPPVWRPSPDEVASVLDVPVAELVDPANAETREMESPVWERPVAVPVRRVAGHLLWGLTLRILDPLLPRVLAGAYPL